MKLFSWLISTRSGRIVLGAGIVVAIPAIALGWWLGSPLFLNKTVDEEFPFTVSAVIPETMTREEAENVMVEAAAKNVASAETMTTAMADPSTIALKSGSFEDEDRVHRGSGTATIYTLEASKSVLRLEDLDVTNGPDLFVLLMEDSEGRDKDQGYVNLGRLKGNRGNQNYEIPADVVIGDHNAIMIYCRAFGVIFSVASLGGVEA